MSIRYFLVIGLIMIISATRAQEAATTNMWLGGTVGFRTSESGNSSTSTTNFIPAFGYHINDNWSIGGWIGISSTETRTGQVSTKLSTTTLAPFVRYTFTGVSDFSFFGQGEMALSFLGGDRPNENSFGLRIRPGVLYSFAQNWGIQLMMPSLLEFNSGPGENSSFHLRVNDGFDLEEFLLNSQFGLVYKF